MTDPATHTGPQSYFAGPDSTWNEAATHSPLTAAQLKKLNAGVVIGEGVEIRLYENVEAS